MSHLSAACTIIGRVRAARVLALALVALALAPTASAEGRASTAPWALLWAQHNAERQRLVDASWSAGAVRLSQEGDRLGVVIAGEVKVGAAGAVDVALCSASGAVGAVRYGGAAADWQLRGGVVVLRLGEGSARSGRVEIEQTLSLRAGDGHDAVIALPAWPGGALEDGTDDLQLVGPDGDGRLGSGVRAVIVRGVASDAPRVRAARYQVTLRPGAAAIALRVEIECRGGRGVVALAPNGVALVDVQLDGKPIAPVDHDDHHAIEVDGRGVRVVVARLQVKTDGDDTDQRVEIGRVAAPITEVEVRVAGKKAIRFEPEVPVTTAFAGGQTLVHGFLPPGDTLQIGFSVDGDAIERTVRFSAETWQRLTLDEGLLRGKATFNLTVVQGKATAVQIAVPDKVVIASVDGAQVATWDVLAASGDQPRRLRVGLSDAGDGGSGPQTRAVVVSFERPTSNLPGTAFEVPVLRPLGAFRESGAVVLLDGEKVGFAAIEGAEGWVRSGLEALPIEVRRELDGHADQVWRHIGAPAALPSKVSAARVREVRLEARGTALVHIDERTLRANHVVVVEVKSGRTDKIVLDLPAAVGEPRVVAPSLSRVTAAEGLEPDAGRKLWELRFSTALEGSVQLQIDLEQLIAADLDKLTLPDVRVRGAEVEVGVLALSAEAGLELTPRAQGETRPVPTTELPDALARQAGRDLVAGFRSPRGAVAVEVGLQRRATVATLDAFARQVWVQSHVLGDGRVASRTVVLVQSAGRPVLRVTLPDGAAVLALTVDGAHVKAVRDDKGGLTVPLGGGAAVRVEIRYEEKGDALGLFGGLSLVAPRFDVRQGPLSWRVLLPGDQRIYRVDSELRATPPHELSVPEDAAGADLVPLPMPYASHQLGFRAEVHDADALASVELLLGAAPPTGLGWIFVGLAALLALLALRAGAGAVGAAKLWRFGLLAWLFAGALFALGGDVGTFVDLCILAVLVAAAVLAMRRLLRGRGERASARATTPAPSPVPSPAPSPAPPPPPPATANPAPAPDDREDA